MEPLGAGSRQQSAFGRHRLSKPVELEAAKRAVGDKWEDECYWLVDETILALVDIGMDAKYHQVSSRGSIFEITGD